MEIEALINERPLTFVSTHIDEPEPLTPSMLVHGRSLMLLPRHFVNESELNDPDYGVNHNSLCKKHERLNILVQQCLKRWRTEYLPCLREAHVANEKRRGLESPNNVKIGDVVLVHSNVNSRLQWPLADVTKLNSGNDGCVRSVEIRTKQGITNRPIAKLYPLEITLNKSECDFNDSGLLHKNCDSVPSFERQKRKTAIKANELIQKWTRELL